MNPNRHGSRRGFTLFELLVVVSIIAVLVAMVLPVIKMVRESALNLRCMTNLRQISVASTAYANDNRGMVVLSMNPAGNYWFQTLATYTEDSKKVSTAAFGQIMRGCPKYRTSSLYKYAAAGVGWLSIYDLCGYSETFLFKGNVGVDPVTLKYYAGVSFYSGTGSSAPGTLAYNQPMAGITRIADRPFFWDACHDSTEKLSDWLVPYPSTKVNVERHLGRGNAIYFDGHVAHTTAATLLSGQGLAQ